MMMLLWCVSVCVCGGDNLVPNCFCRDLQESKATATRQQSEQVLNAIALALPELMGGSADLTPSNLTHLKVWERNTLILEQTSLTV